MEEFLKTYVKDLIANTEDDDFSALTDAQVNSIVTELINTDSIWEALDAQILYELNMMKGEK